jgi:acetate kinase
VKILVINSGSSSVKIKAFEASGLVQVATGKVERIGESQGNAKYIWMKGAEKKQVAEDDIEFSTHLNAFKWLFDQLRKTAVINSTKDLIAVGHRVVHGGEYFKGPASVDNETINQIKSLTSLAPLHIPSNIQGIEIVSGMFQGVKQVAVFDTSFHQSMPPSAYLYALPYKYYTSYGIRRYGFHGTSHSYVAKEASNHLGKSLNDLNLITLHLGNGSSAAAIKSGRCVDTSMGMTPLEGLIMGTRCGSIDPSLCFHLQKTLNISSDKVEYLLNNCSGLLGICGTNDMREVENKAGEGDELSELAISMYCYSIRKVIGSYYAVLGSIDALVFTGGIGENSAIVRQRALERLQCIGLGIDKLRNHEIYDEIMEIQANDSTKIFIIKTNEEKEIARQIKEYIKA